MKRRTLTLWHSLVGTLALLAVEGLLLRVWQDASAPQLIIFAFAIIGSVTNIYVTTEIIEEVKSAVHMLTLLSVVVAEFVVFFTFQYWYLLLVAPGSFPTLGTSATSLLLHSTMVFVFNPLYLPATEGGRALLLINTLASLGLVLFILQNVGQFRKSGR
jgi:hypothetical protein